jgi:hypothetical protein
MDGVFLMISPLPIGSHVINATVQYLSFNPPFLADFTYYLTVQPAPLAIALGQNRHYVLSWPQTPDSYTLQSSSSLSSPNWQPATNLTVSLTNGIYQATAPIGAGSQFFRLRLN